MYNFVIWRALEKHTEGQWKSRYPINIFKFLSYRNLEIVSGKANKNFIL